MTEEHEYVLGTHDEEVERLKLQHRVWRPRALDAWRRAGFTDGQTILDIGCGPGCASLDLAEIVGPSGRVVAIDRSRNFLNVLEHARTARGLPNIETIRADLDDPAFPAGEADGAWCRWVFAFVKHPRDLLARVGNAVRRGGMLVIHEYFDYATWRLVPRCREFEAFVSMVMHSWRASGGEPDVGLELPAWLGELGFDVRSLNPIVEVARVKDCVWQWPKAFVDVNLRRLVKLGFLRLDQSAVIRQAFEAREAEPHALMVTPGLLEIVAKRV